MTQRSEDNTGLIGSFRLTLDGEDHAVPIADGETLLQAALAAGIDAPYSCTEGRCGTCQSRPSSSTPIWLDFDI